MDRKKTLYAAIPLLTGLLFLPGAAPAMVANPILSRGKTVHTSVGNAPQLSDNRFQGSAFNVSAGSWLAIQVGAGPSQVFVNWNNPVSAWSNELSAAACPNSYAFPADYDILKSSNSTNGSDGAWTVAASVVDNLVTARGHLIDFAGASWVKMSVKRGGGSLDEFQVFDASLGAEDTWFFAGTSITQGTFKEFAVSPNFADRIASIHSGFTPAVIRGGIGCINSGDMVRNLGKYLAAARSARYWAIEMGTNDAWGGSNANVAAFTRNLQQIIDSCKAAGIMPVLARTLATNPARTENGWQIHEDYLKAIDDLMARNGLAAGPDLFTWFKDHPGELKSDGVHPNAAGAASIQRLWAEAVSAQYAATGLPGRPAAAAPKPARALSVRSRGGILELRAAAAGTAYIHGAGGRLLDRVRFEAAGTAWRTGVPGLFLIRFLTHRGVETRLMTGP